MKTSPLLLSILIIIATSSNAFRANRPQVTPTTTQNSNHLNIGLIAPHTNFGE